MTVSMHDGFYVVDDVVRVPTRPEGTIEMRVEGDTVWVQGFRFVRGDLPGSKSETRLVSSVRVPVAALEELLAQREGKG